MSKANIYAQALVRAGEVKTDQELDLFFENFISLLKEKNEYKLLPVITKEYKKLQDRSSKTTGTTLIVKDAYDAEKYKKELDAFTEVFSTDTITVQEDKTIVGGFIAKNVNTMLDRSYKKGLIDMYKRLVSE